MEDNEKTTNSRDYAIISIVVSLLVVFVVWSNVTQLDLVTRGQGRVVAKGQNKSVQAPERGTIASFIVEKGQIVSKNEIVATINRTEAIGALEEYETRLENLGVRLARVEAELAGYSLEQLKEELLEFSPDVVKTQIDLFRARQQDLETQIDALQNEEDKLRKQGEIIKSQNAGLVVLQNLLQDEMRVVFPLIEEGIIGKSERFRLEREFAKVLTDLKVNRSGQEKNLYEIDKIKNSINSLKKKNFKDLYESRATIYSEISELKSRIPTLNQRLSQLEIRSPIEGAINRVFFNNEGAVIREGDIIAEIVPIKSGLQVEAFIDPKDIGFIEPGQKAKISLTAYDASKYGYIEGTLIQIAPDTVYREETRISQFSVIVSMDSKMLNDEGLEVDISPGMIAQVDIIRGRRSILEYFWQPVAKIKDTAFKE